jgi:hypothetical protein
MLLKSKKTEQPIFKNLFFKNLSKFLRKKKVLVGLVFFVLYTVLVLGAGYVLKRHGIYGQVLKPMLHANYRMVGNYFGSFTVQSKKISIDIKHIDYLKLAHKRQEALKIGRLHYSPEDWVPATLTHQGKRLDAKIRLKGTLSDHWEDEHAWSFKVKLKGRNTLFGMKRFALQAPKVRNFMNEWFWHKLLRHSGLIALRYDFVEVVVNGRELPIYAIEENFEKRLIENNQLREGPIFMARLRPFLTPALWNGEMSPRLKPIDIYQSTQYSKNVEFMKLVQMAERNIEGFRQGELPFSKVFDANKMGKLLALSDLVGFHHALQDVNSRYYYNPVTGLVEPIAYDNEFPTKPLFKKLDLTGKKLGFAGTGRRFVALGNVDSDGEWPMVMFRDKILFKKYIEALEEISDKKFLDRLFLETEKEGQEKLRLLHRSVPYYEFDTKIFYNNQRFIKKQLHPQTSLNIFFEGFSMDERILNLEIANIHTFPVEILGVSFGDDNLIKPLQEAILQSRKVRNTELLPQFGRTNIISMTSHPSKAMEAVFEEIKKLTNGLLVKAVTKRKINKKQHDQEPIGLEYKKIKFRIPRDLKWSDSLISRSRVLSRVYGASFKTSNGIIPWARHEDFLAQPTNVEKIPFILIEEANKLIRISPGEWIVDRDVIIPAGYRVIASGGTHLDLINNAKILSYSAIEFIGSKENPIVISSKSNSGQGIAVLEAKDKSEIRHTKFDGLSNPSRGGWALTGAITFYESPVLFSNVEIINSQAEDALNIIRSEFTIENTVFRDSFSDSFDSDFSRGVVRNTSFFSSKNDAIDASGSNIYIESIFINGIGDKGISAGEKSKLVVDNFEGKNSRIAVASKDQSEVFIKKIELENIQVGFAVFQKKPEFGPGIIEVQTLQMDNLEIPYLVEKGSSLKVGGDQIPYQTENVAKILYGN